MANVLEVKTMSSWFNSEFFLAALFEWIASVIFISNLPKRFSKSKSVVLSLGMLAAQMAAVWIMTADQHIFSLEPLTVHLLKVCFYIAVMCAHVFLLNRISLLTAVLLTLYAFLGAELAWGSTLYSHYLILQNYGTLSTSVFWVMAALSGILIFGLLFFLERQIYRRLGWPSATWQDLIITLLVTLLCYTCSNLYLIFMAGNWEELWNNTLGTIPRWTFALIGLFILYARRVWKGYLQAQYELSQINQVFTKQKNQYEQARVNAEVINQRYHDLKNQIAILRADIPAEQQKQWLDSLERKVEEIEPERSTGNPVLDTILWEKKQTCLLHDIKLSYVMDGTQFSSVAIEDLCVIFGGALDNAIEAVMKIEDRERRLIHIKAFEQQGYLVICVENINDSQLKFKEGNLISTKKDSYNHGYGIKGIQYTAEKYDGSVTYAQEDDWFRLTVLLHV